VIITGMASDICVLFTANDAYMRDLSVIVPPDCVASENPADNQTVLALMARVLKAEIRLSHEVDLAKYLGSGD